MLEFITAALIYSLAVIFSQEAGDVIVLQEDPNGKVGSVAVTTATGTQTLQTKNAGVEVGAAGEIGTVRTFSDEEIQSLFAGALAAQPTPPSSYLLYFNTGDNQLNAEARQVLGSAVSDIRNRAVARVAVIGHTDRVGSVAVNARLALARAEQVKSFLLAEGIGADIISAISHGERDTLLKTDDGVAEARNRRVEILVR